MPDFTHGMELAQLDNVFNYRPGPMAAPSPKARCHVQQIQGHIVQQNVSCFTRTCFFRSRPANRAEELGARAEELELRTHIFLQVKYGFPTGKIRVPKMKVLKRSIEKIRVSTGKRRVPYG